MNFDCCGTVKQKVVKMQQRQTITKAHPVSGKSKAHLFLLNQLNKTYNEADHIKTCVLACADSYCESRIV